MLYHLTDGHLIYETAEMDEVEAAEKNKAAKAAADGNVWWEVSPVEAARQAVTGQDFDLDNVSGLAYEDLSLVQLRMAQGNLEIWLEEALSKGLAASDRGDEREFFIWDDKARYYDAHLKLVKAIIEQCETMVKVQ
ncbi:MAG: hypothetical protein FOGNACKC_00766 [Anaerolineae bacterium]|nr:hypothetical protein [Anaerolineae bacterium]